MLRDKALIELPPGQNDADDEITFLIYRDGTPRIPFDSVISRSRSVGALLPGLLPAGATEKLGIIDGSVVVEIVVPDLPGWAQRIDRISSIVVIIASVNTWLLNRKIRPMIRKEIVLGIQKARLANARRVAGRVRTGGARRLRAFKKQGKLGRSVIVRAAAQPGIRKAALKSFGLGSGLRIIAGAVGLRAVLASAILIGAAIDVFFIARRTALGFQRAGLPGAAGGFEAGLFDAATFGLFPKADIFIETKTTEVANVILSKLSELI